MLQERWKTQVLWEDTMPTILIIAMAIKKLSVYPDPLPDYGSGRYA